MNMIEKSFTYRNFKVYFKKDVAHWRASSIKNFEIDGISKTITIDEIGNTESDTIEKAKLEIDRQLKGLNQD